MPTSPIPTSPLPLAQLRAVQADMARATVDLQQLMDGADVPEGAFRALLDQGACFEQVRLSGDENPGRKEDVWQRVLSLGRLDLFKALLEADAVRPDPDHRTPHLIARVAASGHLDFLDALLALKPPLNQKGVTYFLGHSDTFSQAATGLVGAVMSGNDAALDRLLDAGADPRGAMDAPVYKTPPKHQFAPLTLLHLARTPHAVGRLVRAGVDPDAEDEYGRTALEREFDRLAALPKGGWEVKEKEMAHTTAMVNALLSAGARPSGGSRGAWSVVVGAAHADIVPLMVQLEEQGLRWPDDAVPDSPREAARILGRGTSLPLADRGAGWLVAWLEGGKVSWGAAEHKDALKALTLVQQGLSPSTLDPKTGLSPLVACLRAGDYVALRTLVEVGIDLSGHPGSAWAPGVTWAGLLETVYRKCLDGHRLRAPTPWWKLPMRSGSDSDDLEGMKSLMEELLNLGNHPAVAAELQRQRLAVSVPPSVPTGAKPRL